VETPSNSRQSYFWLGLTILGYIGVYLCRKNFSVAVPLLQRHFHTTRAEIGWVASCSTVAYATGKFFFGVVVDRIGGRAGFIGSLLLVGLMGILGGLAPTLFFLTIFYSANRFVAAASWPSMVKMVSGWFGKREMPFALALLSLSFVAGGACATFFAGLVGEWSHNNWRMVMAAPSFVLFGILALMIIFLPRSNSAQRGAPREQKARNAADFLSLLAEPQLWVVCGLSFTLTLLRETFNTWLVDFIRTEGGPTVSNQVAAFLSTPFDLLGAVGILAMGWIYGRIENRTRKWLLFILLALLACLIYIIPTIFGLGLGYVTVAIGLIGFLTYGPYSLLAGTLAVEIRGQKSAGTVSGMVDGVGYFAGILAGAQFGAIVDRTGYKSGFALLAGLALISAFICFLLYPRRAGVQEAAAA
jgi:OPA family glycerol-3-phosphate transporter-like MFS transporter